MGNSRSIILVVSTKNRSVKLVTDNNITYIPSTMFPIIKFFTIECIDITGYKISKKKCIRKQGSILRAWTIPAVNIQQLEYPVILTQDMIYFERDPSTNELFFKSYVINGNASP